MVAESSATMPTKDDGRCFDPCGEEWTGGALRAACRRSPKVVGTARACSHAFAVGIRAPQFVEKYSWSTVSSHNPTRAPIHMESVLYHKPFKCYPVTFFKDETV